MYYCSQLSQSLFGTQPQACESQAFSQLSQGSQFSSRPLQQQQGKSLSTNEQSQQGSSQSQLLCIDVSHLPPKSSALPPAVSRCNVATSNDLSRCNAASKYGVEERRPWTSCVTLDEGGSSWNFFKTYHEAPPVISQQAKGSGGEENRSSSSKNFPGLSEAMKQLYTHMEKLEGIPELKATVDSFIKNADTSSDTKDVLCRLEEISDHLNLQSKMMECLLEQQNSSTTSGAVQTSAVSTQSVSCQTSPVLSSLPIIAPSGAVDAFRNCTGNEGQGNSRAVTMDKVLDCGAQSQCSSAAVIQCHQPSYRHPAQASSRYQLRSAEKNCDQRNQNRADVHTSHSRRANIKKRDRYTGELRRSPRALSKNEGQSIRKLLPSDRISYELGDRNGTDGESTGDCSGSNKLETSVVDSSILSFTNDNHRPAAQSKAVRKVTFSPGLAVRKQKVSRGRKCERHTEKRKQSSKNVGRRPERSSHRHESMHGCSERKPKSTNSSSKHDTTHRKRLVDKNLKPKRSNVKLEAKLDKDIKYEGRSRSKNHSAKGSVDRSKIRKQTHSKRNIDKEKNVFGLTGQHSHSAVRTNRNKQHNRQHGVEQRGVTEERPLGILKKHAVEDDVSVLSLSAFDGLFDEQ